MYNNIDYIIGIVYIYMYNIGYISIYYNTYI